MNAAEVLVYAREVKRECDNVPVGLTNALVLLAEKVVELDMEVTKLKNERLLGEMVP